MWARTKDSRTEVVSFVNCKTGATITPIAPFFGGGDRGSNSNDAWCPLLVIVTPAHGEPEPMPNWRLTGPVELQQTRIRYECKRDWFLFFPISQPYCQHAATDNAGRYRASGASGARRPSATRRRTSTTRPTTPRPTGPDTRGGDMTSRWFTHTLVVVAVVIAALFLAPDAPPPWADAPGSAPGRSTGTAASPRRPAPVEDRRGQPSARAERLRGVPQDVRRAHGDLGGEPARGRGRTERRAGAGQGSVRRDGRPDPALPRGRGRARPVARLRDDGCRAARP